MYASATYTMPDYGGEVIMFDGGVALIKKDGTTEIQLDDIVEQLAFAHLSGIAAPQSSRYERFKNWLEIKFWPLRTLWRRDNEKDI